jgi:RNA polymerase sigma-70 factor (ECF subfamily)
MTVGEGNGGHDDRQLVQAYLVRRDERSFVALYRAHTPALYRMACRLGDLSPEAAEEIVQDVWVRATTRLDGFRFESALRTWLIAILIRCAQEHRRREARRPADELDEISAGSTTPHLTIDLERAIARLPEGMREVFLLHDVEGLTHEEVGQCLGVAAGTSKSQLFEARHRLRLWLGRTAHGT